MAHTPKTTIESPQKPKKLPDQFKDNTRLKQYSYRTEKTYIEWVRAYILFHNKRRPKEMGVPEIGQFLTRLAIALKIARFTPSFR